MKTRMVVLSVILLSSVAVADEPILTLSDNPKVLKLVKLENAAKQIGVTTTELTRLRELGFADSEISIQINENKRNARQLITEREVVNELAKELVEIDARVFKLSDSEQLAERERALKMALAKIRRDHRTSKDELRRILANTSFFTPEELRRALGPAMFRADDIKRVFFDKTSETDASPSQVAFP